MKKITFILYTGLLPLLIGCTEDIVKVDQPINETTGKTISVKAGMFGENGGTRILLTPNDLDINLTWEEGDDINLVFSDGTLVVQQTVAIGAVSNQGKNVEFDVVVPEEILQNTSTSTYDLYGIYGNVSFSNNVGEESYVNLSSGPWSGNLAQVIANENTLIRFAETGIDKESSDITVNFQHVGSLFKINIENTGTVDLEGITGVELFSATPGTSLFAHQNAEPAVATLDIISGNFVEGTTTFTEVLPFVPASTTLFSNDVMQLWGWYSPSQESGDIWPAVNLRVLYGENQEYVTTVPRPARTTTTAIGRVYHFFARYNSVLVPELAFTNQVKGSFIDSRDNQLYKTVRIGEQVWMAENLRFFPGSPLPTELNLPEDGSNTEPRYYVYGYNGVGTEGIAAANFANFGVLYNWPAAMAGAEASSTNPSGVQGVCPDGWHLPSEAEWVQLTDFVRTPGGNDAANKLKESGLFNWSTTVPEVTNEYGFSARGGGSRQSTEDLYFNLRTLGHWYTTTEAAGGSQVRAAWMQDISPNGGYNQGNKDFGASVRCVKD